MTAPLDRMQWGFSSLGAPYLDMQELAALARENGMDFLELRAVKGAINLPEYFQDHPSELAVKSVPVRVFSTSLRLTSASDQDVAEFMQYVALAKSFNTPYVRVFGGEEWGAEISPELLERAAKTAARCRQLMREEGAACEMLLETHSGFSSGQTCRLLNERLKEPLVILWDSHHTWKLAKEPLEESWRQIGQWVRHVHYKDSVLDSSHKHGYQYVSAGAGRFPTSELLDLLAHVDFRGGFSLEWEKFWRPELPDLPGPLKAFSQLSRKAN